MRALNFLMGIWFETLFLIKSMYVEESTSWEKFSMPHALLSLIDFTPHYHVWLFHVIAKFWILIKSTSDILNLNGPHRSRALEVWDNILLHICHFSFYLTVWLENINNKFIIMNKKGTCYSNNHKDTIKHLWWGSDTHYHIPYGLVWIPP